MSVTSLRTLPALACALVIAGAAPVAAQSSSSFVPATPTLRADIVSTESAIASAERALAPAPAPAAAPRALAPAAQAFRNDQGAGFGILGMITRADWRTDGFDELIDSRTGWGAGLWFGGNKGGVFGGVGELIYTERRIEQSGLELETKSIEVPLLLRINIGQRSRAGFAVYGVGGPVLTWHLKHTLEGQDVGDSYRSGDIGLMAGAGFEVFHIGIEGRGNWGYRTVSLDGDFDKAKSYQFELVGKIRFN
ncbi:MAG: outer membrane beta-barrel protein [Acidobacteriota bacterium]|jgi:hypothetical protein|nr:MAG: hypothetical protein DIU54_14150 [Acidobacteriota bacterium]